MVAKKKTPTTKQKPAAKKAPSHQAKTTVKRKTATKVDYYPNRVPVLATTAGVSLLVVIALLVTL